MKNLSDRVARIVARLLPADFADDAILSLEDNLAKRLKRRGSSSLPYLTTLMEAMGIVWRSQTERAMRNLRHALFVPAYRDQPDHISWHWDYTVVFVAISTFCVLMIFVLGPMAHLYPNKTDIFHGIFIDIYVCTCIGGLMALNKGEFLALSFLLIVFISFVGAVAAMLVITPCANLFLTSYVVSLLAHDLFYTFWIFGVIAGLKVFYRNWLKRFA